MMRVALVLCGLGWLAPAWASHEDPVDIERVVRSMSVSDKVGQLMIVGFGGTEVTAESRRWVARRRVGGVALFGRNIKSLEQTARLTRGLRELAGDRVPIFIALDQEGGTVVRLRDGATVLPGNMALGATRSAALAYVAGQAMAVDLRRVGFNMNLAPVLDVNSNPKNPVIGVRSYGESPELVGELGSWHIRGQQEMGLAAVAKHFPGHGDTFTDSHFSTPAIAVDLQRLETVELAPFRRAIGAGLDAIMTAHIALPNVTGNARLPATLSKTILTRVLRERLGFDGIIMTDGLEMEGIAERYGSGRAAVRAILAGADMAMVLWSPQIKDEVYNALLKAVRTGEITVQRLDASVRRILRVKARRGIFGGADAALADVVQHRNTNDVHRRVAQRIAADALTLVRNEGGALPLESATVALVPHGALGRRLAATGHVRVVTTAMIPSRADRQAGVEQVIALAAPRDTILVVMANRYHVAMAQQLMQRLPKQRFVAVSLGSPYYLAAVPKVAAYVCAYGSQETSQEAIAAALLGRTAMTGRLPVTLPGLYPYGHRVEPSVAAKIVLAP